MAKRGAARAVRLTCPKCASPFTVVAFLSKGIDADEYWKARAEEHDCETHAKSRTTEKVRNPIKVSKSKK